MCVTFVTCEVRVCGLRCRSGSSLYIYRVYYFSFVLVNRGPAPRFCDGMANAGCYDACDVRPVRSRRAQITNAASRRRAGA